MKIEICTNAEFLAADICDSHNLDRASYMADVANVYIDAALYYLRRSELFGLAERASGQRVTFHGWNGARFDNRIGAFGVFGELNQAHQELLEKADELGSEAAEDYAAKVAAENAAMAE